MQNVIEFQAARAEKTNWHTIAFVTVFHLMAVWAIFSFSWQNLIAAAITWWIAASWGTGMAYHRLLTHGGFKTPKWLEYFMTVCGTLALQSGAITWVTTHRVHHAFTETDKDPHSPRDGAYWSHIGWIFKGTGQIKDEDSKRRYSPDLMKDKVHVFLDKYYWVTAIIAGGILFAVGGWSMVLWAIFLRTVLAWHFTWLVNSATHMWGTRRFETRDDSRNNALVALVTFGEGWHNNHHAHPRSAKHGLAWYEFDVNWIQLKALEKLGLAKKLYAYKLEKEETEEVSSQTLQKAA
jgi:sn-1 stearoyl-lipid 9-desaturase